MSMVPVPKCVKSRSEKYCRDVTKSLRNSLLIEAEMWALMATPRIADSTVSNATISMFMLEFVIMSKSPRSTPSLMMDAVKVGIYNVPATVSNERIDTMMTGNHKGFI